MNWFLDPIQNHYADFVGRTNRQPFWMFWLFSFIISIVLAVVDNILGTTTSTGNGLFGGIFSLAILVPSLAIGARRLHDIGKSGWWQLLWFAIVIGWVVLIYFYVQDSEPGENKYGPNPKGVGGSTPTTI